MDMILLIMQQSKIYVIVATKNVLIILHQLIHSFWIPQIRWWNLLLILFQDRDLLNNLDADGNLFDEDNICNTVVDKGDPQYYYLYNQTSCCTSFSLATTAPNSPPCKAFKSRTTIYNPDFSIFATAFLNLTLNNGQLSTVGGYTFNNGSAQLRYYDGYNNICDTYGNSQLKCTIGVSTDRDHRYFIAAEFVTNSDVFPIADVASFLRDCLPENLKISYMGGTHHLRFQLFFC
uniref:Uncharacterized protein n=1 Tax=Panagrolaimus superbus TaxID=310955 RepID=A0A914Z5E9_9BILA